MHEARSGISRNSIYVQTLLLIVAQVFSLGLSDTSQQHCTQTTTRRCRLFGRIAGCVENGIFYDLAQHKTWCSCTVQI